jgi:peptide deformylase
LKLLFYPDKLLQTKADVVDDTDDVEYIVKEMLTTLKKVKVLV